MMRLGEVVGWVVLGTVAVQGASACTNIVVGRKATRDGSVLITYSSDIAIMPRLLRVPGGSHAAGETVEVKGWEADDVRGRIPQASTTYTVLGLVNEHQVSMGETTTGGRRELRDRKGLLDYDALMLLVLERARTAREAIALVDALCREHGYGSSAETFSIADRHEAWIMELINKGPGQKGIVWVAARVPDDCLTVHANMSRITTFPLDDPNNWLYAKDVISFAAEKGYYDPKSGRPFSYRDAYHPDHGPSARRACAGRVWSVYRRAAPSRDFSDAWFRGEPGAEDYPLFIKPDRPLSVGDAMALMRDHFEGTPYDMTKGADAGPFGSPLRLRPLVFKVDGKEYMWERPISSPHAGFTIVNQTRASLPDLVGGLTWFTPDDASTSCFTPFYACMEALPEPYTTGDYRTFSWQSAYWVMNVVSNATYDRWSHVIPDVRAAQAEQEGTLLKMQPAIEEAAAKLAATDPKLARSFLTNYSLSSAETVFDRWRKLAEAIFAKHVDGYIKDAHGEAHETGYPEAWLRHVIESHPGRFSPPGKIGLTDY
ncbi:Dipeptidase A [Aquisphaera giovannonii]|uniref:Dipeptidase n=1 Tax=Aquisphaera giovannonii TaxID=406548 RepID=A0A5B9W8E8_9BACT|nr:C69 family dipeptidase [Aquisphaera giovannonii]QEH36190.1 Dipeptidase A [Aquisphaera giovannonii]